MGDHLLLTQRTIGRTFTVGHGDVRETPERAREVITRFAAGYGLKYPKAVTTLEKDAAALPLATMRLKAAGDEGRRLPHEGLLMALNLMEMGQARWRRLDGVHLLPLVRAGILFVDGVQHGNEARRHARAA
jgi:hypothetical protein